MIDQFDIKHFDIFENDFSYDKQLTSSMRQQIDAVGIETYLKIAKIDVTKTVTSDDSFKVMTLLL